MLSAGPTPRTPLADWTFSLSGEIDEPRRWTWDEFRALPSETVTTDIHCVTKWSKLDTTWEGVSVDTLLDGVETAAECVVAFCDGGYTTNLPLGDVTGGKAWIAFGYGGEPLDPEHGGPRGSSSAPLPLEERQVGARPRASRRGLARLLGDLRLPHVRRSVAGAALRRRLTWLAAEAVETVEETPRVRTIVLDVPGWPGHRPGQRLDVRLTAEDGYQAQRSYSIASAPGGRGSGAHRRAGRGRRGLRLPRR